MRNRWAVALVLLFLTQPWAGVTELAEPAASHVDPWSETPFRDVAVLEPFSHLSLADYSDVAVIINNESDASRTIGTAFALSRNIPPERVLLLTDVSTPTGETINSDQFTTYFADPISQMIADRNLTDLNVLVTTKGVPLRVNGATNARAAFDAELALIDGPYAGSIFQNWYAASNYGPAAGNAMQAFSRAEQGYYLVTRITGYDVDTALGLLDKANGSLGSHGLSVLDLATNRNGSGYKWWNDLLYTTDATLSGMGLPVHFNQNVSFVTDMENVSMYTSWGSNDGNWGANFLPNSGFDTADAAWSSGARFWDGTAPPLSPGEQWWWARQTAVKRNGNGAMAGQLDPAPCAASAAAETNGLQAEYFDNAGLTYNASLMVPLDGRTPDVVRHESNIDWAATGDAWTGLDDRFRDYWSVRHTGYIDVPTADNWTFFLHSDDGTKLWIDGIEVVNNEGVHGMTEVSNTTWLEAGEHEIRTEFYEHGGVAGFHLSWQSSTQTKQIIPTTAFTRASNTPVRDADLIHHWDFDHSSGDVAVDRVGDANLSFTGTNGTQWRSCILGNCAFFDGVDDVARVDVNDTVGDFTVSLWVQANHTPQGDFSSVIAVNDVAGDNASFQIMSSGGNPGDWQLYHDNRYTFGTVDPSGWQHLMVAFENGTVRQYLDGTLVGTTNVSDGSINSIELYKFGVNRAGNSHFTGVIDEVQIWDQALTPDEIDAVVDEVVWLCESFNTSAGPQTFVEQTWDLPEGYAGHAWILYGYAMRQGDVFGDWWLEVDAYAANGTLLSSNVSSTRALSDSWDSRTVRFRPHPDATRFEVRQVAELQSGTRNGSVFFDTQNLRAIRPHFTWVDGSIAETAVSTGGRTFAWGAGYGQSLVADLLEDGVSGVKGYVYEPYLSAISNPDQLFACYADGYTLAECYAASNVLLSWMGTVVGDPKMAAYADRLHDVNVSEIRAPQVLSKDVNGTLEVLVENLAPGVAVGHLELRDRQNNILLNSKTMTLPGGNDAGSRTIVSIDVTPVRSGYVEFLARWVPESAAHPERITDNNQASLNIEINAAPTIVADLCSTAAAYRGGVVTCEVEVADDFGVVGATLSWRYNGSITGTWTPIQAGTPDGGVRWVASITLSAAAPLDTVDLWWSVREGQNRTAELQLPNAFSINDAPPAWVGVHIGGADLGPWGGTDPPVAGPQSWVRGQRHDLTACVIDLDHDAETEFPFILIDGAALPGVSVVSTSGSQTCYGTVWQPPAGGPLDPVHIALFAAGQEWSNRSLAPTDLPPEAMLVIEGQQHLDGAEDRIRVDLIDPDDPDSMPTVALQVDWPGPGLQPVQYPNTAPMGLDQSDATITATVLDGPWTNLSWSWTRPVLLTPPILSTPVVCTAEGPADHLVRGHSAEILVRLQPGRPIAPVFVQVTVDGESKAEEVVAEIITEVGDGCAPGGDPAHLVFRMLAPARVFDMPLGEVELRVLMTNIDGHVGSASTEIELRGAPPELDFSAMPLDLVAGNRTTLVVGLLDADGVEGSVCAVMLVSEDGRTLLEEAWHPDAQGVWARDWTPPGLEASNHTLSLSCLDETGLGVSETVNLSVAAAPPAEAPPANETPQAEPSGVSTVVLVAIPLLIIGVLTATLLLMRREEEDETTFDEEDLPDEAWSKSAGEVTDEILAEMAGLPLEEAAEAPEEKAWTDAELLEAGWTQDQIDAHRAEQDGTNL